MSETDSNTYSEKLIDELLKAVEELETRERWMYLPFTQLPDPRVRQTILMYVRKLADQTENYAQGFARRSERYGIMISIASMQKPLQDGIILVLKFQVVGVRGDILKTYYRQLKRMVRNVNSYKSIKTTEPIGGENESGSESRSGSTDTGNDTSTNSQKDTSEGYSEKHNDTGLDTSGDSEGSGRVIVL